MYDITYNYTKIVSPYFQLISNYDIYPTETNEYNKLLDDIKKKVIKEEELKNRRKELYKDNKLKYKDKIAKYINPYAKSISSYLYNNKLISFEVNNGFTKLYEILYLFDTKMFKNNNKIFGFHFAEAPGMWIKTVELYTSKKNLSYEWFANSLNPENEENIKKYGKIFDDDQYGLMTGENAKKWLYGNDNTGNITKPEVILDIKSTLKKNNFVCNLITSDAGIDIKNQEDTTDLQKLDFSNLVNIIILSNKKTNAVVKSFSPYLNSKKNDTYNYVNLMISIIYLYVISFENVFLYKPMTSRVTSKEFYIIAINYKNNHSEEFKTGLLNKLKNFRNGIDILDKKIISNYVKYQIYSYFNYLQDICNFNVYLEIQIVEMLNHTGKLDNDFITILENIKDKHMKYWIEMFNF